MVRNSSSVGRGGQGIGAGESILSQPWPGALGVGPVSSMRALATTHTCEVTELGDPILSCATVQGLDLLRSHHVIDKDGHAPLGF